MKKKGWKVVRIDEEGRMFSAWIRGYGEVQYVSGQPTIPKSGCGPLAVFTNRKIAQEYAKMPSTQAVPCTYLPTTDSLEQFTPAQRSTAWLAFAKSRLAASVTITVLE